MSKTAAQQFAIDHKKEITAKFCPNFCFDKDEYIFPTSPEEYAKNVLTAKIEHYRKHPTELNDDEFAEYDLIQHNFFPGGEFDIKGFEKEPVIDYLENENKLESGRGGTKRSIDHLLTFNEKKFGYKLGEKVDIGGNKPDGREVKAPVYTSYVPTKDGAIIRYECFYPLSGAIPGTNWLYKLLPEKLSKKLKDFAVHAGDWEGVYVKVKIDDSGKAGVDHMQTFSHGRSGARKVDASKLHYINGRPCVYVGSATHPSYAENFAFRNKFLDKVGDRFILSNPTEFVDLSPGIEKPAWTKSSQWGRADLMIYKSDYVKTGEEYKEKQEAKEGFLKFKYKPISENKFFNKIKSAIDSAGEFVRVKIFRQAPLPENKPLNLDLNVLSKQTSHDASKDNAIARHVLKEGHEVSGPVKGDEKSASHNSSHKKQANGHSGKFVETHKARVEGKTTHVPRRIST